MAEHAIVGLRADQIEPVWHKIRPLIADAVTHSDGKYEVLDILSALLARDMQAWAITKGDEIVAIVITEIINYPRKKECRVLAVDGEGAKEWVHLVSEIEAWAKANGCQSIEPIARPGWEKLMKPLGYKRTHIILSKEL